MKDLYIVINETKDGKYYGECPMIKNYRLHGDSINEVKSNMLEAVRIYLENNINFMENDINGTNMVNTRQISSSVNPKW